MFIIDLILVIRNKATMQISLFSKRHLMFLYWIGFCLCSPISLAESKRTNTDPINALVGVWEVNLYYSPSEPPSKTTLRIWANANGILSGSFYGTQFNLARATTHDEDVLFTFVTNDNTGDYLSSGRSTSDTEIKGQTLSVGRGFLMAWEANKQSPELSPNTP